MRAILVFTDEAEIIEDIADANDMTEADVIDYLLDFVDLEEFKQKYGFK